MASLQGRGLWVNRGMTTPQHRDSVSELRAALLAAPPSPAEPAAPPVAVASRPTPATAVPEPAREADRDALLMPSAAELLDASDNLRRLCESYHRTHRTMVTRSRRQRLGLGLLVAGVAVGSFMVSRDARISATVVAQMVLAVAGASVIALGALALLWARDERRLRLAQGDRLLRALQFACDLPDERLTAFRRRCEPVQAFFECYGVWSSRMPQRQTGLAVFLSTFGARRAASA